MKLDLILSWLIPRRALYIGDNDLKVVPQEVTTLLNLQILSLRDNNLTELPPAIGNE